MLLVATMSPITRVVVTAVASRDWVGRVCACRMQVMGLEPQTLSTRTLLGSILELDGTRRWLMTCQNLWGLSSMLKEVTFEIPLHSES